MVHPRGPCRYHEGLCSPLLHKDNSMAQRIESVAAVWCQEKAGRINVWGLILPSQVCQLDLHIQIALLISQCLPTFMPQAIGFPGL